jgi:hypothetical protein
MQMSLVGVVPPPRSFYHIAEDGCQTFLGPNVAAYTHFHDISKCRLRRWVFSPYMLRSLMV